MVVGDSTFHLEPAVAGQTSRLILVSGPARSGKSRWAEHLLHHHPVVTYIATAATRPDDRDWQIRLEAHRKRRPDHWSVAESGDELVNVIDNLAPGQSVLIDALGGFVAHHLELTASEWYQLCERLIASIRSSHCTFVLVIEETGWGLFPQHALVDCSGIVSEVWPKRWIASPTAPGSFSKVALWTFMALAMRCHD